MGFVFPQEQDSPTYPAQAVLDSTDLSALVASLDGNGVVSGFSATSTGGMAIAIASGVAQYGGSSRSTAGGSVTISAASTNDRRDIIIQDSSSNLAVVQGTPCSVVGWTETNGQAGVAPPIKPAVPSGAVLLAEVYVPGGASSLSSGNIVQKQVIIGQWDLAGAAAAAQSAAQTYASGLVSTEASARAAADALLIPLTQRGAINGVATLDGTGKIPVGQIPSEGTEVTGVGAGSHVTVDNTNPQVPVVSVIGSDFDSAGAAASAQAAAISAAASSAASTYIPLSQRGAVSGVATLDASSLIPIGQIPQSSLSIAHTQISDWASATAAFLTSAPVTSVFSRTGAISAAAGDYSWLQVTNASGPVFHPEAYGAVGDAVTDSSSAFHSAWTACVTAATTTNGSDPDPNSGVGAIFEMGPGAFVVDPSVWLCVRNTAAKAGITIRGAGNTATTIIHKTGTRGTMISTPMTDPDYWEGTNSTYLRGQYRPIAPVYGFTIIGSGALNGSIGILGSGMGGFYDCFVNGYSQSPTSGWPASGYSGSRGWRFFNPVSTDGKTWYSERTILGPNAGAENCYVHLEYDAAGGTGSFAYQDWENFQIKGYFPGQTGVLVRNSSGVSGTQGVIYGSKLRLRGNSLSMGGSPAGGGKHTYVTAAASRSGAAALSGTVTSIPLSSNTTTELFEGQLLILNNGNDQTMTGAITLASDVAQGTPITSVPVNSSMTVAFGQALVLRNSSGGYIRCFVNAAYTGTSIPISSISPYTAFPAASTTVNLDGPKQAVMVYGNVPVGSSSISTFPFSPRSGFAGASVEIASALVVVGQPGSETTGYQSGSLPGGASSSSLVDLSAIEFSSIDLHVETNNAAFASTVGVYVFPNAGNSRATFQPTGIVDYGTFGTALTEWGNATIGANFGVAGSFVANDFPNSALTATRWGAAQTNLIISASQTVPNQRDAFFGQMGIRGDTGGVLHLGSLGATQQAGGPVQIDPTFANTVQVSSIASSTSIVLSGGTFTFSGTQPFTIYSADGSKRQTVFATAGSGGGTLTVQAFTPGSGIGAGCNISMGLTTIGQDGTLHAGGGLLSDVQGITFNQPSGVSATLTATGTDANISIALAPKGTGSVDVGSSKITSLANGSASSDAVAYGQVAGLASATAAGGDLSGTLGNANVLALRGMGLSTNVATAIKNKYLYHNGASFVAGPLGGDLSSGSGDNAGVVNVISAGGKSIIVADGSVAFSANQSMNGHKLTTLAVGSASDDAVRFDQLPSATNLLPIGSGGTGAASLSALALGSSTATTQTVGDSSTKLATTQFVLQNTIHAQHRSGAWYPMTINGGFTSTLACPTLNRPIATPFMVWATHTYSALGWRTNANANSTVFRAAIYADDGTGQPGALVWESNAQIAMTATSNISYNLSSGVFQGSYTAALATGLYWLCYSPQTSITGFTAYGIGTNTFNMIEQTFLGMNQQFGGQGYSALLGSVDVSGAFPSTYGGSWSLTNQVPLTAIKA